MAAQKSLIEEREIEAYLRAIRMSMLAAPAGVPATLRQIAAAMGVRPVNQTRRMRILLCAWVLRRVHRGETGRVMEECYAANAASYVFAFSAPRILVKRMLGERAQHGSDRSLRGGVLGGPKP